MIYASPGAVFLPPLVLTPFSLEALGAEFANRSANPTSAAWPSSNRALYIPFSLRSPAVAQKVFWANGATASGNTDMGIFASTAGKPSTLLISTGSTAQSGTDTNQVTDIADLPLQAGVLYYMALAHSNATGTFYRLAQPANASIGTMLGVCQSATSLPLAASPTIATLIAAYIPIVGIIFGTAQV